jgi:hypothetical protein
MGFGKRNRVDLNPLHYNIGLLGESGIGKTTIIKEMCEKLAPETVDGAPGYLHLDIGKEDGAEAIEGIFTEKVKDWAKFNQIINDIVKNKYTDPDYANLQTVIVDTYDELMRIAEPEVVRLHNKENPDKPKITSINSAFGGFGRGLDKALEIVFDKLWELKEVGVHFIIIGHTKSKDIDDPTTGESYSTLTANASQKYFTHLKTKLHFLGVGYINRQIVREKTGKKNLKTNEDIFRGVVKNEARVISFRDDNFSVDSKSRFADITNELIPFSVDELIKAMQDAILAESRKGGRTDEENKALQKTADINATKAAVEYAKAKLDEENYAAESAQYIATIQAKFADCGDEIKTAIKQVMAENNVKNFRQENIPLAVLRTIVSLLPA